MVISVEHALALHLDHLRSLGYARSTVSCRTVHLARVIRWLSTKGILGMDDLDRGSVAALGGAAEAHRTQEGAPLSLSTVSSLLSALRMFLVWAAHERITTEPLDAFVRHMRAARRLPRAVLSSAEVERILAIPALDARLGLRDRAILEVLYSTGIRRMELIGLDLGHVDASRGLLYIRDGKGAKDRYVPIGNRALRWVARYLEEGRPQLCRAQSPPAIFLSARGGRIRPNRLTERLHRYVTAAGTGKSGSCHIFRHTMATLMHDRGADIRDLQALLGHASLATTELYTHVSGDRLRAVHAATHPAEAGERDA